MKKIILTFYTFTLLSFNVFSQSDCSYDHRSGHRTVKLFLQLPDREEERLQVGATNEKIDQIAVVSNSEVCTALKNYINSHTKYSEINENIGSEETLYLYQTENFFYAFWGDKPEFYIPYMGPKEIFLVIKKDLSQLWEYYF